MKLIYYFIIILRIQTTRIFKMLKEKVFHSIFDQSIRDSYAKITILLIV